MTATHGRPQGTCCAVAQADDRAKEVGTPSGHTETTNALNHFCMREERTRRKGERREAHKPTRPWVDSTRIIGPCHTFNNQQHFAGARIGGELTHATEARRLSRCNFTCRVKEPKGRASDAEPKDLLERFPPSKREGKNSRARDVMRADKR